MNKNKIHRPIHLQELLQWKPTILQKKQVLSHLQNPSLQLTVKKIDMISKKNLSDQIKKISIEKNELINQLNQMQIDYQHVLAESEKMRIDLEIDKKSFIEKCSYLESQNVYLKTELEKKNIEIKNFQNQYLSPIQKKIELLEGSIEQNQQLKIKISHLENQNDLIDRQAIPMGSQLKNLNESRFSMWEKIKLWWKKPIAVISFTSWNPKSLK